MSTGSVVASDAICPVCHLARGLTYVGPTYAVEEVEGLCPWCISEGTAAWACDAQFTDVEWGVPPGVPASVLDEINLRTPGFAGWQQERWMYHCDDACAFIGRVGHRELDVLPSEAAAAVAEESEVMDKWTSDKARDLVASLSRDGSPTGYLFQCLHCDAYKGYVDFD